MNCTDLVTTMMVYMNEKLFLKKKNVFALTSRQMLKM